MAGASETVLFRRAKTMISLKGEELPAKGGLAKRIAFWLLFACYVGLSVWWTLTVPHDPGRLRRAIPGNAVWISEHEGLGTRWESFLGNGLVRDMLAAQGVDLAAVAQAAEDPRVRTWLRRLLSDEMLVAYVPELPWSGGPGLACVAWVGGWSQQLRWRLALARVSEVVRIPWPGRRPVWRIEVPGLPGETTLTIALAEGMLLACLAPGDAGLHWLAGARPAGSGPARMSLSGLLDRQVSAAAARWPDHGWIDLARPELSGLPAGLSLLTYALADVTEDALECALFAERVGPAGPAVCGERDLRELAALLGDRPLGFCLLPGPVADGWLGYAEALGSPRTIGRVLAPALSGSATGTVFAAVLGTEQGAKVHLGVIPFPVPTLLLGFRTEGRVPG